MSRYSAWWCALALWALSCGSSSTSVDGTGSGGGGGGDVADGAVSGADSSMNPNCGSTGDSCATDGTCCSGKCDMTSHTCTSTLGQPGSSGSGCKSNTDCATFSCVSGACSPTQCIADGQACTDGSACCGGDCANGTCTALNASCKTAGNTCTDNGQCCSKLCKDGACALAASFCIQPGDACSNPGDCCGGICSVAPGKTLGTCAPPPSGATYCKDGVDGIVCDGCNSCCSRLCAPYAPTGVKVCQPASGCHVNGDLCRKDSDCCGAAGTGLPGEGNVHCDITGGQAIGICRNPMGCNPQANVCHFKDYACSISSARDDCCGATGNKGACQLDPIGVPRCYGLDACRKSGETCASNADCCNTVPCVPDATGQLKCLDVPDGGPACSPVGGACTINGDCCTGYICLTPTGSTSGKCGVYTPPPPTPDAGVPYDGGPPPSYDGGPLGCALYGQACTAGSTTECCGGVPCSCVGTACFCYEKIN